MDEDLKKNILKTGTTVLGIVCKDGIVMASDRQATLGGSIVANKNLQKTLKVTDYLLFSICGGLSDAMRYSKLLAAELKLKELKSKSKPTVKQSANLMATMAFSGIRQPSMIPAIVGSLVA
jgi:proteasome beta subunit